MKKIIIIVGIALIIISIVILFVINRSAKKQETQSVETSAADNSAAPPVLPQLPDTKSANINPENIGQSIKENIYQLEASNQPVSEIQFKEGQNQTPSATLQQFEASTEIKISPKVYSDLSQNEYSVFSCKGEMSSASSLGLIMLFKQGVTWEYFSNLYVQMDKNLEAWEQTMFTDLSPLLFPGKKISRKPVFKSTKYTTENGIANMDIRYANMKSDDGANLSIDYTVFEENVYIFNNPQCLRKALDKYEPVAEP
jgi:hypothetical protein